ncbi:MAG: hypothetical protein H7330_15025 [Hymenobacteraceae bacterium]|nr:hypothetical protein [Hymenobacteraceae bacterium]
MISFRTLVIGSAFATFSLSSTAVRAQQTAPAAVPAAPAPVSEMPGAHWVPDYSGGKAVVMRRDNTDIYIMSKPDRPYVVTGRIVSELMPATTDERTGTVVLTNVTISEMIDALLAQGRHRQIFYSFPYDALLTFDGQVGTFVRWKNKPAAPVTPPPSDTSSTQ